MKVVSYEGLSVKAGRESKIQGGQAAGLDAFAALISGLMNLEGSGEVQMSQEFCPNSEAAADIESTISPINLLCVRLDNTLIKAKGQGNDLKKYEAVLQELKVDKEVKSSKFFLHGPSEAEDNESLVSSGSEAADNKDHVQIDSKAVLSIADIAPNYDLDIENTLANENLHSENIDSKIDSKVQNIESEVKMEVHRREKEDLNSLKADLELKKSKPPDVQGSTDIYVYESGIESGQVTQDKKVEIHSEKMQVPNIKPSSARILERGQLAQKSDETVKELFKNENVQHVSNSIVSDESRMDSDIPQKSAATPYDIGKISQEFKNIIEEYAKDEVNISNISVPQAVEDFETDLMTIRAVRIRMAAMNSSDVLNNAAESNETLDFPKPQGLKEGNGSKTQIMDEEESMISSPVIQVSTKRDKKEIGSMDNKTPFKSAETEDAILNSHTTPEVTEEFKDMDTREYGRQTIFYEKNDVLKQVLDRVKFIKSENRSELQVNLKPEELGHVTIKLFAEKGGVTGRIMVENGYVKEIMESNLSQVRDNLKSQGINVSQINVFVGLGQESSPFERGFNRYGWTANNNKKNSFHASINESVDAVNPKADFYNNNGLNYLV